MEQRHDSTMSKEDKGADSSAKYLYNSKMLAEYMEHNPEGQQSDRFDDEFSLRAPYVRWREALKEEDSGMPLGLVCAACREDKDFPRKRRLDGHWEKCRWTLHQPHMPYAAHGGLCVPMPFQKKAPSEQTDARTTEDSMSMGP